MSDAIDIFVLVDNELGLVRRASLPAAERPEISFREIVYVSDTIYLSEIAAMMSFGALDGARLSRPTELAEALTAGRF